MSKFWATMLSTFFYVGKFPFAPGTLASYVATLLYLFLPKNFIIFFAIVIVITIIGIYSGAAMEKILKKKDPGCVVIDEVAGMLIALWGLPMNFPIVITAFFLFRAFDMFKIYPANKLEERGGGLGIMMDDIVAGIYTNLVMRLAIWLLGSCAIFKGLC